MGERLTKQWRHGKSWLGSGRNATTYSGSTRNMSADNLTPLLHGLRMVNLVTRPLPSQMPFFTEMQPNVPTLAPGRSRFNTRYFDRDTRRAPLEQQIDLSGSDAKLIASTEESLVNMSAETGLEPMPNQLPMPTWMRQVAEIQAEAEKYGLPPAAGAPHKFKYSDGGTGFTY